MPTNRILIALIAALAGTSAALLGIDDPVQVRAVAIVACCMALWLSEVVPPFVPTLLLLSVVPLAMPGNTFGVSALIGWMADPVLVLFFGGLTLGIAAQRYGIDTEITSMALRWSGGSRLKLILLVMLVTAGLSMWMSNTAATAMMIAALRPLMSESGSDQRFRIGILVAIAASANLGGMGTPIGSPPNAVAVAALEAIHPISIVEWMFFSIPCLIVLLGVVFGFLVWRYRLAQGPALQIPSAVPATWGIRPWAVLVIFAAMVSLWLSEPWHGIPVPVVAACGAMAFFGSGLLEGRDLMRIDWSTLLLIAGGLAAGRLLQETEVISTAAALVDWQQMPQTLRMLVLVSIAAGLSAVMSNTATATMLIPLAYAIEPAPATCIMVALGCSLGMCFIISTPANALVAGEGVRSSDLLFPGLIVLAVGLALVLIATPLVLR